MRDCIIAGIPYCWVRDSNNKIRRQVEVTFNDLYTCSVSSDELNALKRVVALIDTEQEPLTIAEIKSAKQAIKKLG